MISMINKTLELSKEEMKSLGYKVVDIIAEHFDTLKTKRVGNVSKRKELEQELYEPIPENAADPNEILNKLQKSVFSNTSYVNHPRFFAFIPGPGNFIGALADFLSAGFNIFCGNWLEGSGPSQIEITTIEWLKQMFNFPKESGGIFVSGGSMANLTGLAVARKVKLNNDINNARIYFSDQTHSSIEKGLMVLGFNNSHICKIPSNKNFQLSIDDLRNQINQDKENGKNPFCVILNAGTTNTGAIDNLDEITEFCKNENIWVHVDGAFGAAAILSDKGKKLLKGIEKVDSLSLDPHKWLFQPFEIGCVLVKNKAWMKDAFHLLPDYLKDTEIGEEELNFFDYGIQLTRGFRALKLWMSLKIFGLNSFKAAIEEGFELASYAEQVIRESNNFTVFTPASLALVTFILKSIFFNQEDLDFISKELINKITDDGFAMISSTQIEDKVILRMCTINPRTTREDIKRTIEKLDLFADEILKSRAKKNVVLK